jgi:hypothetical protein
MLRQAETHQENRSSETRPHTLGITVVVACYLINSFLMARTGSQILVVLLKIPTDLTASPGVMVIGGLFFIGAAFFFLGISVFMWWLSWNLYQRHQLAYVLALISNGLFFLSIVFVYVQSGQFAWDGWDEMAVHAVVTAYLLLPAVRSEFQPS